tara:strand:+ start:573 stop:788 length:216 start_codon:yes stop_codon:yes gene_type:complete
MEITQILKKKVPLEICNKIESYLIKDENIKLFCRVCGKDYEQNFAVKKNQDLCPCYISWLYFSRDFENPYI